MKKILKEDCVELIQSSEVTNMYSWECIPDIDKQAYQEACQFVSYYGGSFDFFDKNIENGGEMPITSAIEIGGKWYIVGGNRRMTYYVLSGINPTIWLIKL